MSYSRNVSDKANDGEVRNIILKVTKKDKEGKVRVMGMSGSHGLSVPVAVEEKDVGLTSFNIIGSTKHAIPAYINILSTSQQYHSMIDKNLDFKSQLHLLRGEPKGYSIYIIPACSITQNCGKHYLNDLSCVKAGAKRNSIYVEFKGGKVRITAQFKHREHYQYFDKLLREALKMDKSTEPKMKPYQPSSQICTYKARKKGDQEGLSGKVKFLSGGGGGPTGGFSDNSPQFYTIKADEWMPNHIGLWLDHIFLQPRNSTKIVSVLEYMMSKKLNVPVSDENEKKKKKKEKTVTLFQEFLQFFEECDGTTDKLLNEIELFDAGEGNHNKLLEKVFGDKVLLQTLRRECRSIKRMSGMFNINKCLVLKKRLGQKSLKMLIDMTYKTLKDVFDDLDYEKRWWWNVEACRDYILSLLLFRKEFNHVVRDLERVFAKEEKKRFEDEIGCDNWDEEYDEFVCLSIPSQEWSDLLHEFNQKYLGKDLKLEQVSFRLHIQLQQNDLRRQKEELLQIKFPEVFKENEDINKIMMEIKELEGSINQMEGKIAMMKKRLESSNPRTDAEKMKKIRKFISATESKANNLGIQKKKKLFSLRKLQRNQVREIRSRELRDLEEEISYKTADALEDEMDAFMSSSRRRKIITRILQYKILEISKKEAMSEFPVKLVISILRDHTPELWQKKLLSVLDKFWNPKFCQWGLVHANCQIANIGCHWFSNDLVMISDLSVGRQYEEILAIDCNSPLLINVNSIYERVTKLAEEIIGANINYKYCFFNVIGSEEKVNCQEFTDKMISALDKTDFFPEVNSYLNFLRQDLNKLKDKQKTLNLRYLDVTSIKEQEEFKKKFRKVFVVMEQRFWKFQHLYLDLIKKRKKKINNKKKAKKTNKKEEEEDIKKKKKKRMVDVKYNPNRVYFNTHADVDDFYWACLEIDELFEINYPGVFQLLKAFDRAFWMRSNNNKTTSSKKEEENEEENMFWKPGERGCPFTYEEKQHKEVLVEEEKEEEEEEVEGEDD